MPAIPQNIDLTVYVSLAFLFGIAAQFKAMEGNTFLMKVIRRLEGKIGILFTVILVTTLFSPFILNDVVVIILTPAIIRYSKQFRLDIAPLLVAEITFTNIASSITPFGNPQNILLWSASKISFFQFVGGTLPILSLAGIVSAFALLPFRKRSEISRELPAPIGSKIPAIYLAIVTAIVVAFSILSVPSFVPLGIAFAAGFAFTLGAAEKVAKEFDLKSLLVLFLFVGLVTIASALISSYIVPYVSPLKSGTEPYSAAFLGIVSNLISNVPATQLVLTTIKIPPLLAPKLAVEAGLAGNIDPIASFANLLVLIMTRRSGYPLKRTISLQILIGIISFLPAFL